MQHVSTMLAPSTLVDQATTLHIISLALTEVGGAPAASSMPGNIFSRVNLVLFEMGESGFILTCPGKRSG